MILGRNTSPRAAGFDEINAAVAAVDREAGRDRVVCFRAHRHEAPPGAIIFNLENPFQVPQHVRARWRHHEVWDFSAANAATYGARHVPVGWHRSMHRFERRPEAERDIDVVFAGAMNERRLAVLDALYGLGLKVVVISAPTFGAERDAILARAKLALNMLYYPDGTFPALRAAHLVANGVPVLNEDAPEIPEWAGARCHHLYLVSRAVEALAGGGLDVHAADALTRFRATPLALPS